MCPQAEITTAKTRNLPDEDRGLGEQKAGKGKEGAGGVCLRQTIAKGNR